MCYTKDSHNAEYEGVIQPICNRFGFVNFGNPDE